MKLIRDKVAGLDIHRDTVVACCRVHHQGRRVAVTKRSFSTTTKGLTELVDWLSEASVTTIAMEATGVYWKPVYYSLEGHFDELWLCNAQHVKNVPGRKTDLNDAEWLADVASHGMVRASFVPPPEFRQLRELTRYRKTQVDMRSQQIQRLEKVLQDAGINFTSVASGVWSQSARDIIEAMIDGERHVAVLAQLAKSRMRAKIPQLEEALSGHFGDHHAAVSREIIDHIGYLDATIAALGAQIKSALRHYEAALNILCSITGISETTAQVMIAEMGIDMSRFPTPGHLCAWAGVAPASYESAGKRRAAGTRKGGTWFYDDRSLSRRTPPFASRAATSLPNTFGSRATVDRTKRWWRWRTRCWAWLGICSPTERSTRTRGLTTSPSDTIRPSRQSGSSVGSRRSATK